MSCQKVFFVGGVRSGKSALAQLWAESQSRERLFVATCLPQDAAMRARVARHEKARGPGWLLLEAPADPLGNIEDFMLARPDFHGCLLLDCLGMLLANWLEAGAPDIPERVEKLLAGLCGLPFHCALVSLECGLGLMPPRPLAREFGDLLGEANQMAAKYFQTAVFVSCGLPLILKGSLPPTRNET